MALPSKADHPLNHFKILQGSFTQIYCRSILFLKKGSLWNGMLSIFNVSFDSICIDFLTLTYNVILWHCREKLHCCFHIFAPKKGILEKQHHKLSPRWRRRIIMIASHSSSQNIPATHVLMRGSLANPTRLWVLVHGDPIDSLKFFHPQGSYGISPNSLGTN